LQTNATTFGSKAGAAAGASVEVVLGMSPG
jgi:hypothetical protein